MSHNISLFHQTKYHYDRPVFLSPHFFRLKPAANTPTHIESYEFTVNPANHVLHWQQDPFGNFLARVDFQEPMQEMSVEVKMVANLAPVNPFDFLLDTYAQNYPFAYEAQLKKDLSPYLETTVPALKMQELLNQIDQSEKDTINFLMLLNGLVYSKISYTERMQPGVQTSDETLEKSLGSCRDSAWLLVQVLRNLGLAARFVSGYLVQLATNAPAANSPYPTESDILALHAWAEVFIPGAGWLGLDATSGLFAGEGHIPLACTSIPESAAPVTGTTDRCESTFNFVSKVTRLK